MYYRYLSHFLNESCPCYGGETSIKINQLKSLTKGNSCNSLHLSFSNHTSTHVDVPYHFFPNGKKLDNFKPESWIFKNIALIELKEVFHCELINWEKIEKFLPNNTSLELLLIKTGFEKYRGQTEYWSKSPGLHPEVADKLKSNFPLLRAIGLDIISISSWCHRSVGRQAHKEFLGKEILLFEDMRLAEISSDPTIVMAFPLLIEGADAAPLTVIGGWEKR